MYYVLLQNATSNCPIRVIVDTFEENFARLASMKVYLAVILTTDSLVTAPSRLRHKDSPYTRSWDHSWPWGLIVLAFCYLLVASSCRHFAGIVKAIRHARSR